MCFLCKQSVSTHAWTQVKKVNHSPQTPGNRLPGISWLSALKVIHLSTWTKQTHDQIPSFLLFIFVRYPKERYNPPEIKENYSPTRIYTTFLPRCSAEKLQTCKRKLKKRARFKASGIWGEKRQNRLDFPYKDLSKPRSRDCTIHSSFQEE